MKDDAPGFPGADVKTEQARAVQQPIREEVFLKVGETIVPQGSHVVVRLEPGHGGPYAGALLQSGATYMSVRSGDKMILIKPENVSIIEITIPEGVQLTNTEL